MIKILNSICLFLFLFSNLITAQQDSLSINQSSNSDSVVLLNAAVVKAYQLDLPIQKIPGNLSVLKIDALNQADANNLATSINRIPGVNMQSGTFSTNRIVIRGMGSRTPYNSNRIRAYLNDIPLTSSDGVSTPEDIDLQSIGRIEIIKGPSSALYGSGLGGSINMFTPINNSNQAKIGFQFGSFNTAKFYVSGSLQNKNGMVWASLNRLQSDGYRENNQYQKTSIITTSQWKSEKWNISSTLLVIDLNAGIPSSIGLNAFENNPNSAANNWKAIKGFEKYRKGVAGISLENKIKSNSENQLILFGKWNNGYEKRPFNNLSDQNTSFGFRNKFKIHSAKMDWVIGEEFINEGYEWKLDLNDSLVNNNRELRNQANLFVISDFKPISKLNISVAAAMNYAAYKLIDLYAANGDQSGEKKFPVIFSPRIGINFAPNNQLALYASAGHGFSLPSPEETLLPQGDVNPDIKPEQGMQYEIGSRINLLGKNLYIDANLYWIELNNLLVTKRISEDIFTGINAGKTSHRGFELQIQSTVFDSDHFPGKLNSGLSYTMSVNRFVDFVDDSIIYNGNHLPGIPNQLSSFQLTWNPFTFLEFYYGLQYSGSQYLNDSNSMKYGDYYVSNLKISSTVKLKKSARFNIYFGINNLANAHYASMLVVNALSFGNSQPRYYYPALARNFYGGIQFGI